MDKINSITTTQKVVLAFVLGLILGGGATFLTLLGGRLGGCANLLNSYKCNDEANEYAGTSTDNKIGGSMMNGKREPVMVSGTNAIAVDDQKAGTIVEVTMVTFSQAGWVAIHEETDGVLGKILGAKRFEPGIYLGEVELLRATTPNGNYYAILHLDDGDKQFDPAKDPVMKNTKGEVIMAKFKTLP